MAEPAGENDSRQSAEHVVGYSIGACNACEISLIALGGLIVGDLIDSRNSSSSAFSCTQRAQEAEGGRTP